MAPQPPDPRRAGAPAAPAAPRSAGELFTTFAVVALQSFGGALAHIERTVVGRKRWLTSEQFVGLYAISQVLPGPTGISFCVLLGDRFLGLRGAAAALAGFVAVPAVAVLSLAALFQQFQHLPQVQGALHGMGAAAVGLIVHTAARMARTLRGRWVGIGVALATFTLVGVARQSVRTAVLTLGVASVAWAWHTLRAGDGDRHGHGDGDGDGDSDGDGASVSDSAGASGPPGDPGTGAPGPADRRDAQ